MNRFVIILIIFSLLTSCNSNKAEPAQEEESHHEEQTNFVSLTEEQMKTAGIELGKIELKNLKTSIRANGMLTVPNQNKALVTTLYSGVVRTLRIQPGSYVRKGQIIATIINPDIIRFQQELLSVNAEITMAETEERRQKELIEGNAAPLKNLQRVQTQLRTLRAQRTAVQKQLSTLGISPAAVSSSNITSSLPITAPISGSVSTVQAQIGSNVDPSTPIAEIVNNSLLHLDLFIYEKDLPRLKENQIIHFTLTNNPGKEYDAKIYSIGTAFAPETKTIPVHAVVMGDKAGLIEGMSITALISIGTSVVPAVPSDAIVSQQNQDFIFVQTNTKPEEHHESEHGVSFERIPVVKGASDVGYTEVTLLKNIPPHTPVVTKGSFFVLAKMTNVGGHEH